jgi:basic membrane lipoprotein Med (substrate-binding protein (PBP1-ABC) superfamily)
MTGKGRGGFLPGEEEPDMTSRTGKVLVLFSILVGILFGSVISPASAAEKQHKFAIILPGPIEDADYNYNGYLVAKDVEKRFGLPVSHSERVAPADAERVTREYVAAGYTMVAYHGAQFIRVVQKVAPKFPEVSFIIETSGKIPFPKNVWNIRRFWPEAFHPFGILAGMSTKSNKVGVIAGVPLPDWKGGINTIWQGIKEVNPKAELFYAFTGDQNDPVKARQTAEAQLASGVDFIISMVNLGVYGVIEAIKKADHKVLMTTFHTDKSDKAPKHVTVTLFADWRLPFRVAVEGVLKGTPGGYVGMSPGTGFSLGKFTNVSEAAAKATRARFEKMTRGEMKLRYDLKAVHLN